MANTSIDRGGAVRIRYARAAQAREPELWCPVAYDPKLLDAIPLDVRERDYGSGNPAPHLRPGESC